MGSSSTCSAYLPRCTPLSFPTTPFSCWVLEWEQANPSKQITLRPPRIPSLGPPSSIQQRCLGQGYSWSHGDLRVARGKRNREACLARDSPTWTEQPLPPPPSPSLKLPPQGGLCLLPLSLPRSSILGVPVAPPPYPHRCPLTAPSNV